ncbi:MAG TPA: hypothetical protein PKC18_17695 [Lacipirellulaceae bacterium]|nr:hypothetical protein [Lacipirellulaceae bacterium]
MSRTAAFWAPSAVVIVLFAAIYGVAGRGAADRPRAAPVRLAPGPMTPEDLAELGADKIQLPDPSLSPADVVAIQLAGLADPEPHGVGILQCFALASPANREVTGPLDRFGILVRTGEFACLTNPRATTVGRAQIDGDFAAVVVTVLDRKRRLRAFHWVLAKQIDPPYEGCWMTEAVHPAGDVAPAEPAEPSPEDPDAA